MNDFSNIPVLLITFNRKVEAFQTFNELKKVKVKRIYLVSDGGNYTETRLLEKIRASILDSTDDVFRTKYPNGKLQTCKYINGNIVLVAKAIYRKIGIHSSVYTHGIGDYDYGLRALHAGFNCYTTKKYIATCPTNKGVPAYCVFECIVFN